MNRKLITLIICVALATAAGNLYLYSRHGAHAKVPQTVLDAFSSQYPGVKAEWEEEMGNYEAGFEKDGREISISYDRRGRLLETEEEIEISEAPAAIPAYAGRHYHERMSEICRIRNINGIIMYEAELGNFRLVFDAQGKLIREEK